MREDFLKYFIKENEDIKRSISLLDEHAIKELIVVDEELRLLGTITDGDIRRGILSGVKLEESVSEIMFKKPVTALANDSVSTLHKLAKEKDIKIIPIIENNKIIDLYIDGDSDQIDIPVVLMAGGLGSRLGDLTKECPKPMLKVGGKPVLERIIDNFNESGFNKFYVSVNYKKEMIEEYFEDGARFNCQISYLREDKRLGTAGALGLLPKDVDGPVILMNGDLLTQVDFTKLVEYHKKVNARVTMCVREYDFQVPYGVVNIDEGEAISFDEKPVQSFFVNAGVYMIDSSLFHLIPKDEYFDMSNFLNKLLEMNIAPKCFPLLESWIDIGKIEDLNFARSHYGSEDLK